MIYSTVNHQELPFSDPTHPPLWWRNTWMVPYQIYLCWSRYFTKWRRRENCNIGCHILDLNSSIIWCESEGPQSLYIECYYQDRKFKLKNNFELYECIGTCSLSVVNNLKISSHLREKVYSSCDTMGWNYFYFHKPRFSRGRNKTFILKLRQ